MFDLHQLSSCVAARRLEHVRSVPTTASVLTVRRGRCRRALGCERGLAPSGRQYAGEGQGARLEASQGAAGSAGRAAFAVPPPTRRRFRGACGARRCSGRRFFQMVSCTGARARLGADPRSCISPDPAWPAAARLDRTSSRAAFGASPARMSLGAVRAFIVPRRDSATIALLHDSKITERSRCPSHTKTLSGVDRDGSSCPRCSLPRTWRMPAIYGARQLPTSHVPIAAGTRSGPCGAYSSVSA